MAVALEAKRLVQFERRRAQRRTTRTSEPRPDFHLADRFSPCGRMIREREGRDMSDKRFYAEITVPFKGDRLLTAARIIRSVDVGDYVLYEQPDELSLGMDVHGRLTMYPDRIEVTQEGRVDVIELSGDPSQSIHAGLRELRVEGWRAYGTAAFELARVLYGLPVSGSPPLVTLFVPAVEFRIGQRSILVRALDPGRLVAFKALVEDVAGNDGVFASPAPLVLGEEIATHDADVYRESVGEALEEIRVHRYRKVILSRKIPLLHSLDMVASFIAGRRANTPARSYLLRLDGLEAGGFSPETVVEVTAAGDVFTTPLAGTRSTGDDLEEELDLREELLSDSKEIAEHAISVYVGFDELTMACDPTTVSVVNFMLVSRRGAVQHLASRLKGRLLKHCCPWHAFNALFPAVTASGVPKRESIDAIGRFESGPRGLYAGCVMICDDTGTLDAALVLRSFYQRAGRTWLQAGAGIMNMSKPERELEETREKLRSFSRHLISAS